MRISHKSRLIATIAAVATAGASLAACSTVDVQNQISSIQAQVQADANLACGFIPTIATIAAFIPGAGGAVADAATIAQGICAAIAAAPVVKPASRLRSVQLGVDVSVGVAMTPNGPVTITGHFTR